LPADAIGSAAAGESSASVRARVVAARDRQVARYGESGVRSNSELTPGGLRAHCPLTRDGIRLMDAAIRRIGLTARGYDRVRKVARTIADLSGDERIEAAHLAEALQFRSMP
jgi:magnesium chelatase family protein